MYGNRCLKSYEIWDRGTWNEFYEESEESFEDIAEDLIDFDF